jgi:hypothetical protein
MMIMRAGRRLRPNASSQVSAKLSLSDKKVFNLNSTLMAAAAENAGEELSFNAVKDTHALAHSRPTQLLLLK